MRQAELWCPCGQNGGGDETFMIVTSIINVSIHILYLLKLKIMCNRAAQHLPNLTVDKSE